MSLVPSEFLSILQHTPLWVWSVLVALVGFGALQTRNRSLSVPRATLLPLVFVGLSLSGVLRHAGSGSDLASMVWAAWALGFAAVGFTGRRRFAVRGARWLDTERRIHVPGSWLPMQLMVGLFLLRYGAAVAAALEPALVRRPEFFLGCNFLHGGLAAVFWIRSSTLRRLVRQGRGWANHSPMPAA